MKQVNGRSIIIKNRKFLKIEEELSLGKTQVMVFFSLCGDSFPLDDVTEKLEVMTTETLKNDDLIPNRSKG